MAAAAGGSGLVFAQRIREEAAGIRNFRLDVAHGDPHLVARLGFLQQLLGGILIKFIAVGAGSGLAGFGIHNGVCGSDVEFLVELTQINGIGFLQSL